MQIETRRKHMRSHLNVGTRKILNRPLLPPHHPNTNQSDYPVAIKTLDTGQLPSTEGNYTGQWPSGFDFLFFLSKTTNTTSKTQPIPLVGGLNLL